MSSLDCRYILEGPRVAAASRLEASLPPLSQARTYVHHCVCHCVYVYMYVCVTTERKQSNQHFIYTHAPHHDTYIFFVYEYVCMVVCVCVYIYIYRYGVHSRNRAANKVQHGQIKVLLPELKNLKSLREDM